MADDFGRKIGVEGEKEFKKVLSEIYTSSRLHEYGKTLKSRVFEHKKETTILIRIVSK